MRKLLLFILSSVMLVGGLWDVKVSRASQFTRLLIHQPKALSTGHRR